MRNTDLPVPEGPSRTEISPAGRVRVTSSQIDLATEGLGQPFDRDLDAHRTHLTVAIG